MASIRADQKPSFGLLKTSKGSVPVSKLPADVLVHIFVILRDVEVDKYWEFKHSCGERQWNWVAVSRVCSQWRNLALDCASLWSKIVACGIGSTRLYPTLRMIGVFLERSRQAKLHINLELESAYLSFDEVEKVPAVFDGHMHRVRALQLTVGVDIMNSMIPRLLELTPNAKVLMLNYEYELDGHSHWQDMHPLRSLPDMNFDVQLDVLSLDCFALPWSCSLYHGLSELTITHGRTWCENQRYEPTIWRFIDALEHCPNLTRLHLHDFSPVVDGARIQDIEKRRLVFPLLRSITLENLSPLDSTKVLAMFAIGPNVDVDVLIDEEHEDDIDYPDVQILQPLPPNVLIERERCKTICISMGYKLSTVESGDSRHTLEPDSCAAPPVTSLSALVGSFDSYAVSVSAVCVLLEDQFWQIASDVTITFKSNLDDRAPRMNRTLWCSFLDGLPKFVKRLTVKFTSNEFETCDIGLDEAMSALDSGGQVRLRELEQLTICYKWCSVEFQEWRRDIFSSYMEERNRSVEKECKLSVLDSVQ